MRAIFVGAACALISLHCMAAGSAARVDTKRLLNADQEPGQWLAVGRTYDEQRFSPLTQINTDNVSQAGPGLVLRPGHQPRPGSHAASSSTACCTSPAPGARSTPSTRRPASCCGSTIRKVPGQIGIKGCCDVVNRGVAAWSGKHLSSAAYDGRLIALDAKTGKVVWSVLTADHVEVLHHHRRAAHRQWQGDHRQCRRRDRRARLHLRLRCEGRQAAVALLHRARRSREALRERAAAQGCGHVDRRSVLEARRRHGVGRHRLRARRPTWCTSAPATARRGWPRRAARRAATTCSLNSIVAVDADTGKYAWHYQMTPAETWDYDATSPLMMADLKIDGAPRRVVMQASKNGFFYVLDAAHRQAAAREELHRGELGHGHRHADRPARSKCPRRASARPARPVVVQPGGQGAHSWHPMSFSRRTGLLYTPMVETSQGFAPDPNYKPRENAPNAATGRAPANVYEGVHADVPRTSRAFLIAWDPVSHARGVALGAARHHRVRRADHRRRPGVPGRAARASFAAYRDTDGQKLWSTDPQTGVVAAPVTYRSGWRAIRGAAGRLRHA